MQPNPKDDKAWHATQEATEIPDNPPSLRDVVTRSAMPAACIGECSDSLCALFPKGVAPCGAVCQSAASSKLWPRAASMTLCMVAKNSRTLGLGGLRLVEGFCAGAKSFRRSGAPPPGLPPCIRRALWPSFQIRPECSGNVWYYAVRGRHRLVLDFCAGAEFFRRPRLSRAISRAF